MSCGTSSRLVGGLIVTAAALGVAVYGFTTDDPALASIGAIMIACGSVITGAGSDRCCCARRLASLFSRRATPRGEDAGNPYRDLND